MFSQVFVCPHGGLCMMSLPCLVPGPMFLRWESLSRSSPESEKRVECYLIKVIESNTEGLPKEHRRSMESVK